MDYEENLMRWALFCPEAAEKIKHLNSDIKPLKYIEANSKLINLQTVIDSQDHYFHDPKSPLDEANTVVKEANLEDCEILYVYGIGLGYFYEALREWLEDPRHTLVFFEDQLQIIDAFLHTDRAKEVLAHPRVWIYYLEHDQKGVDKFINHFALKKLRFIALPLYLQLYQRRFKELQIQLTFIRNLQYAQASEYNNLGTGFFINYFQNLFKWPSAYIGDGLFGKFNSVPAIICGAGPSLSKNIDVLATLSERALIFAGGTSMNVVNAKGIEPHFGIGIDPNFEQSTRIIMNKAFDIPFFYRSRINNDALNLVSGDVLYLSGNSGYSIADHFDAKVGIASTDLEEGCNVINFSLAIAEKLGCNPIILVGVDLAYSNDKSYADGVTNHPIHSGKKLFRTKEHTEELISYTDIYGKPVFTLWKWITESMWFTQFAAKHPHINLINATEGGIGFENVKNMPLKQVAEDLLTKQLDLKARIFGEIQDHPMPPYVNAEYISEILQEFAKSLEKSISLIKDWSTNLIDENYEKNVHEQTEEAAQKTSQNVSSLPNESLHKEEIAYKFLLEKFESAFDNAHSSDIWRLDLDAGKYSQKELENKRIEFQIHRLTNLSQTAQASLQIIERVLKKEAMQNAIPQQDVEKWKYNPEESPQGTVYAFKDKRLTIVDSELDLKYDEPFHPSDDDKQAINYDDGTIKYESYVKNGSLHGPSSFYSPKGKLLVQHWYIDGLLQGQGMLYYSTGELYGIQRYRHGLKHGIQLRLYKNGIVRSIIPYENGLLNGELVLVHENGIQARSLYFNNGKRNGMEKFWNKKGQLTIEAEFKNDLPIGTAHLWYDNGILAQEALYDENSELSSLKRWNSAGGQLDESQWKHLDYFEDIAKQTGTLTDNISVILNQVNDVAAIVTEKTVSKPDNSLAKELSEEFAHLKEELDKLHSLQSDLLFESGLDGKNPREGIWKTPSIQREFQHKLDAMTKELHNGVAKLQTSLGHTVQELKKDANKAQEEKKSDEGPVSKGD